LKERAYSRISKRRPDVGEESWYEGDDHIRYGLGEFVGEEEVPRDVGSCEALSVSLIAEVLAIFQQAELRRCQRSEPTSEIRVLPSHDVDDHRQLRGEQLPDLCRFPPLERDTSCK
jgi:hypothetical protein